MVYKTTGFHADTYKRLVVGPGAVYINYGLADERLLGATRGGNTFEPGISIRQVEVDGVKGKVKGGAVIDRVEPVLRCNMLEFMVDNLLAAIPGLKATAVTGTAKGEQYQLNTRSADGGTFKLKRGPHETAPIPYNATAAFVQHELERLYNIGDVTVTKAGIIYTITFAIEAKGGQNLTADLTGLTYPTGIDPNATFAKIQDYDPGTSYTRLQLSEITPDAYLKNVALVGRVTGSNTPVVVIVKNVLAGGGFSMGFVAAGEMVSELRLEGYFEPPAAGVAEPEFPFEIRWPPEA